MLFRRALACCAAAALMFLAACQSKQGSADVMATVDGRKIFRADVEKYYSNQTAGTEQQQPQTPVGEQATSLRLSILRELIDDEILMHRAEKLGLLATDEEVDRKMNEIKSPYTQEQFDQKLRDKKITLEDFRRDLRRSLTGGIPGREPRGRWRRVLLFAPVEYEISAVGLDSAPRRHVRIGASRAAPNSAAHRSFEYRGPTGRPGGVADQARRSRERLGNDPPRPRRDAGQNRRPPVRRPSLVGLGSLAGHAVEPHHHRVTEEFGN